MFERSASRFLPARALAASALLLVAGLGACNKGDAGKAADSTAMAASAAPKPKTVAIIRAADWIGSEWSEDALKVGLQEAGLEPDRDFVFTISSAQGDLATLPSLIDAALDAKADVIVALQDETLKSAVERVKNTPVVFNVLSDPFAAGAGTSDSSHLPNITGVYSPGLGDPEQRARVALIQKVAPNAKRIGVLFSPLEPLAVSMKDKMTASAKAAGLTVVAVPISSPTEGAEATTALIAKKVGAIEIYGNSAHAAFESIIKVAKENKVPVFSPSPFEVVKGATAAFFPDFQEGGVVAGGMVAKALKGESLASVPFYKLEKTKTSVAGGKYRGGSDSSPVTVRAVPSYDGAGGAVVRLEGRLDAEGALELEDILAQFLREGVRTATVDLSRVTYMSTPALHVLARGGHEFATVKGELRVAGPTEAIQQQFDAADLTKSLVLGVEVPRPTVNRQSSGGLNSLRGTSEWRVAGKLVLLHGLYESAARHPGASLTCQLLGDPAWLERGSIDAAHTSTVQVGEDAFGFGVGAIGHTFAEASPRLGELIGAAGVVAYQPTEGSGVPDYLIGTSEQPASTVVASGLLCRGAFETLSRFTKRPGGQPVPLSELARVCLDHSSSASVGVVMLVEVAGLVGARLRRSPGDPARPVRFAMPDVRDAFSITPERVHEGTVAVVTGVVSRNPDARLTPLLRPIGMSSDLLGHFHAAVFEFRPVPLRTVALRPLMTKYFSQQPLRSVMHLLHDDRGAAGAGESAFLRGICWVSPITAIEGGA